MDDGESDADPSADADPNWAGRHPAFVSQTDATVEIDNWYDTTDPEPAPTRRAIAGKWAFLAVLLVVGAVIVFNWAQFIYYAGVNSSNSDAVVPFILGFAFTGGYVWVLWRVLARW